MSENKFTKIDRDKLPWYYKLILKIRGINKIGSLGGVFWSIIVPIFLLSEFFLSLFLLLYFAFPINVILTAIIPVAVFMIFLRISLERFINWWNAMFGKSPLEWDVEKTVQEYIKLLNKREKKNE